MRVALEKGPEEPADLGVEFLSVSTSRDGSRLAGQCIFSDGDSQGCIYDIDSGGYTRIPGVGTISPNGRYVAYESIQSNPYGISQIYVYDSYEEEALMVSALPGWNSDPAWPTLTSKTCLAFAHYETMETAIYLSCFSGDEVVAVPVISYGESIAWFDE
jgi:Tol biopolymer transport system component